MSWYFVFHHTYTSLKVVILSPKHLGVQKLMCDFQFLLRVYVGIWE
jgi:hypothetical protein